MSTDLEDRLRHDLAKLASTTRTDPRALESILARAAPRPIRARRRPAMALAIAGLAAVVVGALLLQRLPDPDETLFTTRPNRPPAIEGTVLALVEAGQPVRFEITSPEGAQPASTVPENRTYLAGGWTVRQSAPPVLIDPTGVTTSLPVENSLLSAAMLADRRVAMIINTKSFESGRRRRDLRTFDPAAGSYVDQRLPSNFQAGWVAAGPDGAIAVLGARAARGEYPAWEHPELLVIGPHGERRHSLDRLFGDRVGSPPIMSWGPNGLVAISSHPIVHGSQWTLVVDPSTGRLVRAIDGYQGLAWSPDGLGLLTARRTGPASSELALWWGPDLRERIDIGTYAAGVLGPELWSTAE